MRPAVVLRRGHDPTSAEAAITSPVVSLPDVPPACWTDRLRGLRAGAHLTIVGLDEAGFLALPAATGRSMLKLDLARAPGTEAAIARILDDLADLALATWPAWPDDAPTPWRRAADRLAAAAWRPRFSRVPPATQVSALYPAAGGPILAFPLDAARPERAGPLIAAMEWACRHGAAALAWFSEPPPSEAPWDRVLHGAVVLDPAPPAPAAARLVPPLAEAVAGSAIERRMRLALRDDSDLGPLFDHEVTLRLGPLGPTPRCDLVWQAGKVVVELDGLEHERNPTYAADRHRDYELTAAGYLVLRLTNAEVELDLARCLAKVRRIVDLRRPAP